MGAIAAVWFRMITRPAIGTGVEKSSCQLVVKSSSIFLIAKRHCVENFIGYQFLHHLMAEEHDVWRMIAKRIP